MNAVIIGATGLIGANVLAGLLADDRYNKVLVLGRRRPALPKDTDGKDKLIFIQCQLEDIPSLAIDINIDHAFCCLGTTIKQAGSQENFTKVDVTAVIDFAKLIQQHQVNHNMTKTWSFLVVTALDANVDSSIFYNRAKGKVQQALIALSLPKLVFFQPSLLLGQRQSQRPLEDLGQSLFKLGSALFVGPLLKYKPITGEHVATVMLQTASRNDQVSMTKTVEIIDNKTMHQA